MNKILAIVDKASKIITVLETNHWRNDMNYQDMKTNCYKCKYRGTIPGGCHTRCLNPDPEMTGDEHGIKNGWFNFPWNFDPIWLENCDGYEEKK